MVRRRWYRRSHASATYALLAWAICSMKTSVKSKPRPLTRSVFLARAVQRDINAFRPFQLIKTIRRMAAKALVQNAPSASTVQRLQLTRTLAWTTMCAHVATPVQLPAAPVACATQASSALSERPRKFRARTSSIRLRAGSRGDLQAIALQAATIETITSVANSVDMWGITALTQPSNFFAPPGNFACRDRQSCVIAAHLGLEARAHWSVVQKVLQQSHLD